MQRKLAPRVSRRNAKGDLRLVAGLDAAFSPDGRTCLAAVVLWDRKTKLVREQLVVGRPVRFPYIPGLLSFREIPTLLAALRRLSTTPDVLMCDGHGLAHPRRFGIASHLGVVTALPSIGCAKSLLVGEAKVPGPRRGCRTALRHQGETLGVVLRTQTGVNPVYVSIGHEIDLPTAVQVVLSSSTRYRLPEPTRLADRLVALAKRHSASL